jgi:hypothetical protein
MGGLLRNQSTTNGCKGSTPWLVPTIDAQGISRANSDCVRQGGYDVYSTQDGTSGETR